FGIAKIAQSDLAQQLTRTGESVGSPPYMSPEQCQGKALDARSDVYSLGCLLYELICGKPPLQGASSYETIHKQMTDLPDPIAKSRPDLRNTEAVDAIILKAMAKNPDQRFQSMREFAQAIERLLPNIDESSDIWTRLKLRSQLAATRLINRPTLANSAFVVIL